MKLTKMYQVRVRLIDLHSRKKPLDLTRRANEILPKENITKTHLLLPLIRCQMTEKRTPRSQEREAY